MLEISKGSVKEGGGIILREQLKAPQRWEFGSSTTDKLFQCTCTYLKAKSGALACNRKLYMIIFKLFRNT